MAKPQTTAEDLIDSILAGLADLRAAAPVPDELVNELVRIDELVWDVVNCLDESTNE